MPDNTICPADHKHGQNTTCYTTHRCRCEPCRTATSRRGKERRSAPATRLGELLPSPEPRTPSTATVRRLRALVAIGYTPERLAFELRLEPSLIFWLLLQAPTLITERFAARAATLFEQHRYEPSMGPVNETLRARALASAQGWKSPIAWTDIERQTDEPGSAK